MNDQSPHGQQTLADLTASRLCHDLVNPLGAIGNGVELIELTGSVRGPEMDLIRDAVRDAQARMRFLRIAFGASGSTQILSAREARTTAQAPWDGTRLSLDWGVAEDLPRVQIRLGYLMLLCAETALPMGGEVRIGRAARARGASAAGGPPRAPWPRRWRSVLRFSGTHTGVRRAGRCATPRCRSPLACRRASLACLPPSRAPGAAPRPACFPRPRPARCLRLTPAPRPARPRRLRSRSARAAAPPPVLRRRVAGSRPPLPGLPLPRAPSGLPFLLRRPAPPPPLRPLPHPGPVPARGPPPPRTVPAGAALPAWPVAAGARPRPLPWPRPVGCAPRRFPARLRPAPPRISSLSPRSVAPNQTAGARLQHDAGPITLASGANPTVLGDLGGDRRPARRSWACSSRNSSCSPPGHGRPDPAAARVATARRSRWWSAARSSSPGRR